MSDRVAVIGLGRVGLPLALSFADRGCEVLGIERDPLILEEVGAGRMPFAETGTQELLDRVHAPKETVTVEGPLVAKGCGVFTGDRAAKPRPQPDVTFSVAGQTLPIKP